VKISHVFHLSAIISIIALLTVSCTFNNVQNGGSTTSSASAEKSKTSLRFICSWGGVDSKAESLKTVIDKFVKANTDIEVVNESLFGEDFLPKIKTDFASGNNPDVFGIWPGSDIRSLIKAGKVADLTGILDNDKAWKQSFDQKMWDYTTYNNKIYGLPVEIIFESLFLNRDLFYNYNLKPPQTFEDLKNVVKVFKENDVVPIALNTYSEGTYLYQNFVAMLGGKEDTEKPFNKGKVKSCYIEAMNYVKELYEMGAFPHDCFTLTNNERNVLFKEKKAAMIAQGSWYIGDFQADDYTIDIIPFPSFEKGKSPNSTLVYGLGSGCFYMSSSSAEDSLKRDASIKLLKALTSQETAAYFASETGMISNVDISKYNINYRRLTIKGLAMISNAELLVGPADSFIDRSSWETDISQQFPYFLEGKISAEELWNKAIANGIIPN